MNHLAAYRQRARCFPSVVGKLISLAAYIPTKNENHRAAKPVHQHAPGVSTSPDLSSTETTVPGGRSREAAENKRRGREWGTASLGLRTSPRSRILRKAWGGLQGVGVGAF
jgi:hypothetical protein